MRKKLAMSATKAIADIRKIKLERTRPRRDGAVKKETDIHTNY